ncbi:meiosis inhibitor protein 1-like isoform X2 [Mya arenaria]|nr:meiosis inhibitor protein 1-like isoform X2 [Mya arenaria]
MMLSWERGDSPEWYIQCLNLLADLDDLDTMATSELLYKLLTAGFLTSLLELKQRFNSGILTRSIGKVLSLLLICCQSKGLLPSNMDMPGRFTLDGLDWKVADLQEVFGGSVLPQSVVESYLLLLYIDLQLENRILSPEQLAAMAQATVDHQCAVDQLSPLAQKHFIYLLAYVCVAGSCNISCIISNGVGSVARLMEGRMEDWYTHNPVLLHWVFLDPILAGTCRHSVLLAFLTHANKEEVVDLLCVENNRNTDQNAFLQLAQGQAFMMALLRILTSGSIDVVSKAMLMCETLFGYRSDITEVSLGADTSHNVQQKDARWEDFDVLFEKVSESVAKIFLKSCPESEDHNLTSLLCVLLMLCEVRPQCSVDVKVIYHVLNTLGGKSEGLSTEVKRVCLLVILATLSTLHGTREQANHPPVCTMVCQHDGFLGHLQACLDGRYGDEIFSIATDILTGILSYPDVKCSVPLELELTRLYTIVTQCSGSRHTASVGLLGAVYRTGLSHGAISLTGRLDEGQYRALHIYLQQLCLQESEVSSAAVSCMVALLKYLLDECPELGCELVSQPWNLTLLDVILDISDVPLTDHQVQLITMLVESKETCTQLQHYDGLVEKLVTVMNQGQNHGSHGNSRLAQLLLKKFQSKLTAEECVVLRKIGSCASAFSVNVPQEV